MARYSWNRREFIACRIGEREGSERRPRYGLTCAGPSLSEKFRAFRPISSDDGVILSRIDLQTEEAGRCYCCDANMLTLDIVANNYRKCHHSLMYQEIFNFYCWKSHNLSYGSKNLI